MKRPSYLLTLALSAGLLAGCAKDAAPAAPLDQQGTEASLNSISEQLQNALERSSNDEGILALTQLPYSPYGPNPLSELGYSATLPRGTYTYDAGTSSWTLTAPSDDLSLTWPYQGTSKEATLLLDWDASSPTRTVLNGNGASTEVPTGATLNLTAAGQEAADVGVSVTYYEGTGCPAGILEPTSLTVDGAGSLLTLEDVGFSTAGEGSAATLQTQGKVTLKQDDIYLSWNITAQGGPARGSGCSLIGYSVGAGTFSAELGGFTGDTRSLALRFGFTDPDGGDAPVLSNGAFVVNGEESRAVTFEGAFTDTNSNGVPGDDLTVTYPDGTSSTLEDLLSGLNTSLNMLRLIRP